MLNINQKFFKNKKKSKKKKIIKKMKNPKLIQYTLQYQQKLINLAKYLVIILVKNMLGN